MLQVRQIIVHNDGGLVSFDWQTQGDTAQRARLCFWRALSTGGRCMHHKSNFTFATADFWCGSLTIKCWDAQCKQQWESYWKGQPWALPSALCGHRHLFTEPESWPEEGLQQMLAPALAPQRPLVRALCWGERRRQGDNERDTGAHAEAADTAQRQGKLH